MAMGNGPQFCQIGPGLAVGKVRQLKAGVAGEGVKGKGSGQGGKTPQPKETDSRKHHLWSLP